MFMEPMFVAPSSGRGCSVAPLLSHLRCLVAGTAFVCFFSLQATGCMILRCQVFVSYSCCTLSEPAVIMMHAKYLGQAGHCLLRDCCLCCTVLLPDAQHDICRHL
jgi:hypothetical protein